MKLTKNSDFTFIKRIKHIVKQYHFKSYAQRGEDVLFYCILSSYKPLCDVRYLDVGCGKPRYLSNTYLLYKMHAQGWCCDANIEMKKMFKRHRERDVFLNCFVVGNREVEEKKDFYIMDMRELSTASSKCLEYIKCNGFRIRKKIKVDTVCINDLLSRVTIDGYIDLLNIDVEGFDKEILFSIDFEKYSPYIICVEAVDFETGENSSDTYEIISFMKGKGYILFCNTNVNLIFLNKEIHSSRKGFE